MKILDLYSETVPPNGSVTSQGVLNQLGRPRLDLPAVLVREAVQNSWDARAESEGPILFGLAGWTLSLAQREYLCQAVFNECPPDNGLPLETVLKTASDIHVLAVYDRGTEGLSGPTRADQPSDAGERRDFVDFLRNVGQPPDKTFSGGTYGYGKAALYRASETSAVCIHTRCLASDQTSIESRFMAAALGAPYELEGRRFTGRHWWGIEAAGVADPILNEDADYAAEQLGMPGFVEGDRGTTILLVQPRFEQRSPLQAMSQMAEYLLWYFWPKMLLYDRNTPAILFEVSWQGEPIYIPNPEDFPPLQGFVKAMYKLKEFGPADGELFPVQITNIACQRPIKHLGRLALHAFPVSQERPFYTGENEEEKPPFASHTHHTALLRQPELVVRYLPGELNVNEHIGYAGVFISDEDVDSIFAQSEPPTHDDWIPKALDGHHKSFVNPALNRISNAMSQFAKPASPNLNTAQMTPLGAFAHRLGGTLLPLEAGITKLSKPMARPPIQPTVQEKPSLSVRQSINPPPRSTLNPANSSRELEPLQPVWTPPTVPLPPRLPSAPKPPAPPAEPPSVENPVPPLAAASWKNREQNPIHPLAPRVPIGLSRVKTMTEGEFILVADIPALRIQFEVEHGRNAVGTLVTAETFAVLEGSQIEKDPPVGASFAQVLCWTDPEGQQYEGSSEIYILRTSVGVWTVDIFVPDDIMVHIDLKAEARGSQ